MPESWHIPGALSDETLRLLTALPEDEIERRLRMEPAAVEGQPSDQEVAKLVKTLKGIAFWRRHGKPGEPEPAPFDIRQADRLDRAASLLEQLSAFQPQRPIPVSERLPGPGDCGVDDWLPIDTAPKDGTEILASDYDAIEIVSWIPGEWVNREGDAMYPAWWQPLPEHPPLPEENHE